PWLRHVVLAVVTGCVWLGTRGAEQRPGIDMPAIDRSVPPQQDFWQFANGKWLAATEIPADRSAWDTFSEVRERTQGQLRSAIEAIEPNERSRPERGKLADLYASFMDEAGVEQAGLTALGEVLGKIDGLRDKGELPALFAELTQLWVHIPFMLSVSPDKRDATTYVAYLEQGRLGLPDREYYLSDDSHFVGVRTAYRAHIEKM